MSPFDLDFDLSAPSIEELPAEHPGAFDDLDFLGSDSAAVLEPAAPHANARRTPFDDLLSEPPPRGGSALEDELDFDFAGPERLAAPAAHGPKPPSDLDLDMPPPRAVASSSGLDLDEDDLALPEPRARAVAPESPAKKRAGGTGFGELDLGDGDSGEELEFEGLAEEEGPDEASIGMPDLPEPETYRGSVPGGLPVSAQERVPHQPTPGKGPGLDWKVIALGCVLLLLVGGGAALHFTPFGLFGVYAIEEYLPQAGTAAEVQRSIQRAEERAASDTYIDARAALADLAAARRGAGLNRELLVRSLVHEALYDARFGGDAAGAARAARILARLEERAALVPQISLARAADELLRGVETTSLAAAAAASPEDP
ncbi:MAG: hypothetical protein H5U40_00730, partial [Polyangiaceae bacterium]|nr:hypothetical protein [Polyangiaceae bacterium]